MKKYLKYAVGIACLIGVPFLYQNCSGLTSNTGFSQADPNTPVGASPSTTFVGTTSPVISSPGPRIQCDKNLYFSGENLSCQIENADENTYCFQTGTSLAERKKCTVYGWVFDATKKTLKFQTRITDASVGNYNIWAENVNGSSSFEVTYALVGSPAPVPPAAEVIPVFQCGLHKYQVGEVMRCWILNGDASTICSQTGTQAASEKLCTTYGWSIDVAAHQLTFSTVVGLGSAGVYTLKAKNSSGSSTFDLELVANIQVTDTPPAAPQACYPGTYVDTLLGRITPSGVVGQKDNAGNCELPYRCDTANGYYYPTLYQVGDSTYGSPVTCVKYKAESSSTYTWGGQSGLAQCSGYANIMLTNDPTYKWDAFSAGFMFPVGDGNFPLKMNFLNQNQTSSAVPNGELVTDSSRTGTCVRYYLFNNINPAGYPATRYTANSNSGNSANSYSADICDQLNAQIRAAFPNDTKSNRCSKANDYPGTVNPNTGQNIWNVSCRCDTM